MEVLICAAIFLAVSIIALVVAAIGLSVAFICESNKPLRGGRE